MKFAKIKYEGKPTYACLQDERNLAVIEGCIYDDDFQITDKLVPEAEAEFLLPVDPKKLLAIGLNYLDHVKESGSTTEVPPAPVIFMKSQTSLCLDGEDIILPKDATVTHYEAEIGIVIKKEAKNVTEEDALNYVRGYIAANDVSERVFQRADGQWTRAKSYDTFNPVSKYIADVDASDLAVQSYLNGELRQNSRTSNMINPIPFVVSYLSQCMTLLPGDVIITGTPAGVGPMKDGDVCKVVVENVGTITSKVKQG